MLNTISDTSTSTRVKPRWPFKCGGEFTMHRCMNLRANQRRCAVDLEPWLLRGLRSADGSYLDVSRVGGAAGVADFDGQARASLRRAAGIENDAGCRRAAGGYTVAAGKCRNGLQHWAKVRRIQVEDDPTA